MLVEPVSSDELTLPKLVINVYQDARGNWFAGYEHRIGGGLRIGYTHTYDDWREAVQEAVQRVKNS